MQIMAPLNIDKKSKKSTGKPDPKTELSPKLESSYKPAKALKRKKGDDNNNLSSKEPPKVSKKAKKNETLSKKPKKASKEPADLDAELVGDIAVEDVVATLSEEILSNSNKKKGKGLSKAAQEVKPVLEDKPRKSKNKSQAPTSESVTIPTPSLSTSKEPTKKATTKEVIPTSISCPRKLESTTQKSKSKKFVKAPTSKPEASASEDKEEGGNDDGAKESDEDSNDNQLHGFSTDEDSSDKDDAMDNKPADFDIRKLPTIAKDDMTVKMKLEKAKWQPIEDRGVLFLAFGDVMRVHVLHNKKTGRSKHYGFIEFDSSAVAKIVTETMDNYLLMGHILHCKLIPKEEVHPELWVGANRKWQKVPAARVTRDQQNKLCTEVEQQRATNRLLKRQLERKDKLARAGIKYDFEGAGYKQPKQVKV
ncbi:unnamed protein product [Cyclocybe aegerita]|uniref:RRM domain-containing protein n=1 Tax=Cyclocybe aegerita TaxID=1973307 RepID=A0A8S0WD68_CYCAE|nr:unnamed protein product [Cyclocybe aegerita]